MVLYSPAWIAFKSSALAAVACATLLSSGLKGGPLVLVKAIDGKLKLRERVGRAKYIYPLEEFSIDEFLCFGSGI